METITITTSSITTTALAPAIIVKRFALIGVPPVPVVVVFVEVVEVPVVVEVVVVVVVDAMIVTSTS